MKRLVVNADDFGMSPGVDRGILECVRAGVVTSVSVLVWDRRPPSIPEELIGRCGIHLRLTDGPSLAEVEHIPTLLGPGNFFASPAVRCDVRPEPSQVRLEWELQMEVFKLACSTPTHADSHHHVHGLAGIDDVYEELVAREGIAGVGLHPAQVRRLRASRIRCADYAETRTPEGWQGVQDALDEAFRHHETVHFMVHPGYADETLAQRSKMVSRRQWELEYLLSPRFQKWLIWGNIDLVGMAQL